VARAAQRLLPTHPERSKLGADPMGFRPGDWSAEPAPSGGADRPCLASFRLQRWAWRISASPLRLNGLPGRIKSRPGSAPPARPATSQLAATIASRKGMLIALARIGLIRMAAFASRAASLGGGGGGPMPSAGALPTRTESRVRK